MTNPSTEQPQTPDPFEVRVLRQDQPGQPSYWQTFGLQREPSMNVTSVLQRIAADPTTVRGERVAPVAYDANCLEEVCPKEIPLMTSWARAGRAATLRLIRRLFDG